MKAVLRLLGHRPRSEHELRQRLRRRFSPEEIEGVIRELKSQGLVDDLAFARFWRDSRERHRPRGVAMIRQELLSKGVDRDTVSQALEGLDEEEGAFRAGLKLLHRVGLLDYREFRNRMGAYLQRRGFRTGAINSAISQLWQELADAGYGHVEGGSQ